MVDRVRNVIKRDRKKSRHLIQDEVIEQPPKRQAKESELLSRYAVSTSTPSVVIADPESLNQHEKAITTELAKAKPHDAILLPLMKSMYHSRRMFVLD